MRMTPGQLRWFKAQFGASLMAAAAMLGITEIAGAQGTQATTGTTGKDQVTGSTAKDIAPISSSAPAKIVIGQITLLRCRF